MLLQALHDRPGQILKAADRMGPDNQLQEYPVVVALEDPGQLLGASVVCPLVEFAIVEQIELHATGEFLSASALARFHFLAAVIVIEVFTSQVVPDLAG